MAWKWVPVALGVAVQALIPYAKQKINKKKSADTTAHTNKPLLERPYASRQLIIVADDEVVAARHKASQELAERQEEPTWALIAELMINVALPRTGTLITALTKEVILAWSKLRESGIAVATVARSEANQLKFPPGHPRDKVIYVGHPGVPEIYYPLAQFHRKNFEHKFSEAISLLMALGATEISAEHISGWSTEFSSSLNISLPQSSNNTAAKLKSEGRSGTQLIYRGKLKGSPKPSVPPDLVWYKHEDTWQQVADGRLRYGLEDFSLILRYEDDYGVNAGLKLSVEKAGLDAGGTFKEYQATVWKIEGKFDIAD